MVFKKNAIKDAEPFIEPIEVAAEIGQMDELFSQMPDELAQQLSQFLQIQNNDFTANTISHTALDETPEAITILSDLVKQAKDGGVEVLQDENGNWLDFIGAKGFIPLHMMEYNRRANYNSIVTTLVDDCYEVTYEVDENTGVVLRDSDGEPIVLKRVAVNVGTRLRNLNQSCELASAGARATLQAKVLGAVSGTSPIGMDGTWDSALQKAFLPRGSKR